MADSSLLGTASEINVAGGNPVILDVLRQSSSMADTNEIWTRGGFPVPYPGLIQTDNTCVLVSLAGAINYLTGTNITEQDTQQACNAIGSPDMNFGVALKCLDAEINQHSLTVTRYHDRENTLPSVNAILAQVTSGSVLIPSFQLATGDLGNLSRVQAWHMLSIFNHQCSTAQAWDTNNRAGFVTDSDITDFLTSDCKPIPYPPLGHLVSHDQHEAIVVSKPCV